MKNDLYPQSVKEAVDRWDAGDSVWTIEMGGMGPGYEQAIQVLLFEILRDYAEKGLPSETLGDEAWAVFGREAISRSNESAGGYSGAQVGAAKNLAAQFLRSGWQGVMGQFRDDPERKIQVSRFWPTPPTLAAEEEKP